MSVIPQLVSNCHTMLILVCIVYFNTFIKMYLIHHVPRGVFMLMFNETARLSIVLVKGSSKCLQSHFGLLTVFLLKCAKPQ